MDSKSNPDSAQTPFYADLATGEFFGRILNFCGFVGDGAERINPQP